MSGPRPPTPAERAHFAAIARAKAAEKRDQIAEAARAIDAAGIVHGLQLAAAMGSPPDLATEIEIATEERRRAAGQIGLRLRWMALRGRRRA